MVIMLDSIAAARFSRAMPITHALLESWKGEGEDTADVMAGTDGAAGAARGAGRGWRSFQFEKFAVVGSNSPRNQCAPQQQ